MEQRARRRGGGGGVIAEKGIHHVYNVGTVPLFESEGHVVISHIEISLGLGFPDGRSVNGAGHHIFSVPLRGKGMSSMECPSHTVILSVIYYSLVTLVMSVC